MRKPMMSGHCATPSTSDPESSHARCAINGAGNKARPSKEFQPCPCRCHYKDLPRFRCGECGKRLVETSIENDDPTDIDENGDLYPVYIHIKKNGTPLPSMQECP